VPKPPVTDQPLWARVQPTMSPSIGAMVAVIVLHGVRFGRPAQHDFEKANADTIRLQPAAFPELPAAVRADLEQRGCTVPQPFVRRGGRANVIRGRFLSATPTDVAVLCSTARRSAILVYRGGAAPPAAVLEPLPDATFLQVVDRDGSIGFSRSLSTATPGHVRRHAVYGPAPAPALAIDHDGIEDAFLEKGSSIWYWSGGKWSRLPGAD
jgi:hypothetical protein